MEGDQWSKIKEEPSRAAKNTEVLKKAGDNMNADLKRVQNDLESLEKKILSI